MSGKWNGATLDSDSGMTNIYGKVTFSSDAIRTKTTVTFTFTVDSVSKAGYMFDKDSSAMSESYP